MDTISIQGLKVSTIIGAHPWERTLRQTLLVDLEFAAPVREPAQSDDLQDAVDYDAVSRVVHDWIVAREAQLIETVAEGVAGLLLGEFSINWVRVSIWKPGAIPSAQRTGVTIERGKRNG
ncbi:Dihydroneopterin aldolase [gamma proteobacterium HdN1]|nr:Dihydroneopterin aldolase [gamma proteobacterium HdN1]